MAQRHRTDAISFSAEASFYGQSGTEDYLPWSIGLKDILFTTPTLSNDIAELEPVSQPPKNSDFSFHEDEWSQIEFFPKTQLAKVQQLLKEFKPFEEENRTQYGWRKVYVRRIQRLPVITGAQSVEQLEKLLNARVGSAPLLFSSGAVTGRVKNGFSLSLEGNITLYGYSDAGGIPVLGVIVGENPDNSKLTDAFMKLNLSHGLILVDWRSQIVWVSVNQSDPVEIWRP